MSKVTGLFLLCLFATGGLVCGIAGLICAVVPTGNLLLSAVLCLVPLWASSVCFQAAVSVAERME